MIVPCEETSAGSWTSIKLFIVILWDSCQGICKYWLKGRTARRKCYNYEDRLPAVCLHHTQLICNSSDAMGNTMSIGGKQKNIDTLVLWILMGYTTKIQRGWHGWLAIHQGKQNEKWVHGCTGINLMSIVYSCIIVHEVLLAPQAESS